MKRLKIIFLSLLISLHINAFDEFLVSDIRIVGLQRVSTGSIFNVIPISVGDRIDLRKSTDIVRSLFSTAFITNGLFIAKKIKTKKIQFLKFSE